MKGTKRHTRELYAESLYGLRFGVTPPLSVRDERYKFISGSQPELYDVARDPSKPRTSFMSAAPLPT